MSSSRQPAVRLLTALVAGYGRIGALMQAGGGTGRRWGGTVQLAAAQHLTRHLGHAQPPGTPQPQMPSLPMSRVPAARHAPAGWTACGPQPALRHNQGRPLHTAALLCHRRGWRPRAPHGAAAAAAAAAPGAAFGGPPLPVTPEDADDLEGPEGELHAVETAIRANALIFAAKLGVFFVSNSSSMLAEAVHSLVDIANQMLLRVGIIKARRQPTDQHPYGYARDQFIWPLISAVGIFCCGAGVSFVHGVTGLFEPHKELGDLYWNFVVLGVSGVLESHSLYVAVNTLRRRAAAQGMGLLAYVRTGADPAAVAVMMEDGAAVAGLIVAAGCLGLCQLTGAVYWDAVGSIAVAGLLGVVAVTLIQRNRKWLIGKSMPKAQEEAILAHLAGDRVIRQVSNIKSEELGVRQYRFQADIAFDGEELARRALDRCGRTRLFKALDAAVTRHDPHALDALLMQFAAVIVSTTGAEVDRIEREIMRLVPGTRWVDLETDRGKPARSSATAAAAAAVVAEQQQQQQQLLVPGAGAATVPAALAAAAAAAAAASAAAGTPPALASSANAESSSAAIRSASDSDHLADLAEYPLGSLMSFDEGAGDVVPDWIRTFAPSGAPSPDGTVPSSAAVAAAAAAAAAAATTKPRLGGADGDLTGGNYLRGSQMLPGLDSDSLYPDPGSSGDSRPFCDAMHDSLAAAGAASSSSSSGSMSRSERELASGLQLAAWSEAEAVRSSEQRGASPLRPGGTRAAAVQHLHPLAGPGWGEQEKEQRLRELHELEDTLVGSDADPPQPFCESMFQQLHPDASPLLPSAAARAASAQPHSTTAAAAGGGAGGIGAGGSSSSSSSSGGVEAALEQQQIQSAQEERG